MAILFDMMLRISKKLYSGDSYKPSYDSSVTNIIIMTSRQHNCKKFFFPIGGKINIELAGQQNRNLFRNPIVI